MSENSFDKWVQKKIMKDYDLVGWTFGFNSFNGMAIAYFKNHKTKNVMIPELVKYWHISEKKARLYARYIIGYAEDAKEEK